MRPIGTLVLAAGESKRMGRPKQLLPIGDTSLILHTIRTIEHADIPNIQVVLGAHSDEIERELRDHPVGIFVHENWRLGIGSSLKTGLEHLLEVRPEITGLLVCVCDQPAVTSAHIQQLVHEFHSGDFDAVASGYAGSAGVPAILSRRLFPDIKKLGDDEGAQRILKRPGLKLKLVPLEGGEIDIDTPSDYKSYLKRI
jgi:molybdenum cofactor cytidylyltransferase